MSRSQMTRRAVLRGAGVSITLPFLESWLPAAAPPEPAAPLRVVFLYAPNGKHMPDWTPSDVGALADLPPTLRPLKEMADHVTILSGLALRNADANGEGPGDHARAMAAFLTGCRPHKTSGADVRLGVSIDQVIAATVGRATRLPSLEIGCEGGKPGGACDNGYSCAYQTNLSWRTASSPMPKETNPRIVFERLFGDRLRPEPDAVRARRERERQSVLDFVAEDAQQLGTGLAGADRRKLDEYLTSIREVERRLTQSQPAVSTGWGRLVQPAGVPENFEKHARLLADLVALAFQADLTRVVTFVLGNDGSNRSYREVGVPEGHHDVSYHGNDPARHEKLRRIMRWGCASPLRRQHGTAQDTAVVRFAIPTRQFATRLNGSRTDMVPQVLASDGEPFEGCGGTGRAMLRHLGWQVASRINSGGFAFSGDPVESSPKEMQMKVKNLVACALATACAIVASSAAVAWDEKGANKIDGGKGSAFKSKKYEIKERGEIAVVLSFEAGKEVTVATKGDKETDVNLFVKGMYFEAKDTSPGPECLVKFTPVKGDGEFTFTIKNNGPGANKVTLEVRVAE